MKIIIVKDMAQTPSRNVAQSMERRTLELETRGSKSVRDVWCWGRIPPTQSHLPDAARW